MNKIDSRLPYEGRRLTMIDIWWRNASNASNFTSIVSYSSLDHILHLFGHHKLISLTLALISRVYKSHRWTSLSIAVVFCMFVEATRPGWKPSTSIENNWHRFTNWLGLERSWNDGAYHLISLPLSGEWRDHFFHWLSPHSEPHLWS